ncbi:MAG: SIR2 family protein [Gammaproteobacteria bacterium]|nr:SIR2 family protein [Gammaproteobacteria bacterium]
MPIEKVKQSAELIKQVELFLENGLNDNESFNTALDGEDVIAIRSLQDHEQTYHYKASEVLYWVDRTVYLDELDNWNGEQLKEIHAEAIQHVSESNQEAVFSDLVGLIKRKKVAPFVGAGISAAAGYPSWESALRQLGEQLTNIDNDDVEQLISENKFLRLAQELHDASSIQLNNHVHTTFRVKPAIEANRSRIPEVIQLLSRLCSGAMVTTNFDTLIEDWFKSKGAPEFDGFLFGLQQDSNFIQKLLKGDRCLLKLHGDASQSSTYVFTEEQYRQGYGENEIDFRLQLPKALRQIYISHSLLFLGCSLVHDKTMQLFKHVKEEGQFVIPEHFALLAQSLKADGEIDFEHKQVTEDRLLEIGIRPIWYSSNDNHKMLTQLLELAVNVAENRVALRGVE